MMVYGGKILSVVLAWLSLGRLCYWTGNYISDTVLDDHRPGDPYFCRQGPDPQSVYLQIRVWPGQFLSLSQSDLLHLFNEDNGDDKEANTLSH